MESNENIERRRYTPGVAADDPLYDLLDEEAAATRRAARVRERWLRRAAEESATFAGTLLDLAEAGAAVTIHLQGGQRRGGRVVGLGADFVALRAVYGAGGEDRWIRLAAITRVRVEPGSASVAAEGDRPAPTEVDLLGVLADAAADASPVVLSVGDETLSGRIVAVGTDVISIRSDDGPRSITYVSATSLCEVVVLRSG
ncbi:MAG: hypothetical protein M3R01_07820 [Actinomycetota bacterium]|nr:hypothetical protein [Actinomycetota bacterium]